jgi:hypothetical protein
LKNQRILILAVAAVVCFLLTALIPPGCSTVDVELTARANGDGGPGRLACAEAGEGPVPISALGRTFELRRLEVPAGNTGGCRLRIEPFERAGVALFLTDLRISARRGIWNRVWDIDPGRLASGKRLIVTPVKDRLWRITAPDSPPVMVVDLDDHPPVRSLRAGILGWLLFWAGLLLLAARQWGGGRPLPWARLLVYAAALLVIAVLARGHVLSVPPGAPPDELAHLSYVVHLDKDGGRLLPDYGDRKLYTERGARLVRANYLAHPPFYYHLLRPFAPDGDPRLIFSRLHDLRLVNLALGLAGIALFLWVGCREDLPLPFHAAYAAAMAAVPMLPYLAGAVNNDNLLLLAGGLGVYGTVLFLGDAPRGGGLVLLGAGLFIAMLVKATAGLQLIILTGLVLLMRIRRDRSLAAFRGIGLPIFLGLCLLPAAWYLWSFATYGTFIPQFGDTWYDLPDEPVVMGFFAYLRRFFRVLALSFTGILSHESVFHRSLLAGLPLLLLPVLACWGLLRRDGGRERPFFTAQRLAFIALLLMMVFHFTRVYRYHLASGYPGGMQARYYFPLMPAMLMLSLRPFVERLHRPAVRICLGLLIAALAASTIALHW